MKIITWVYIGYAVASFLVLIFLSKIGYNYLPAVLKRVYVNLCHYSFCIEGLSLTKTQISAIFYSEVLPVLTIFGFLQYTLYKNSWVTYRISLTIFLFILLSQLVDGSVNISSFVFPVLLLTNPVRRHFKKPAHEKFPWRKVLGLKR